LGHPGSAPGDLVENYEGVVRADPSNNPTLMGGKKKDRASGLIELLPSGKGSDYNHMAKLKKNIHGNHPP